MAELSYISDVGIYTFGYNRETRTKISNDINYDVDKTYSGANSIRSKLFPNDAYLIFHKSSGAAINNATIKIKIDDVDVLVALLNFNSYVASSEFWYAIPIADVAGNVILSSSSNNFTDNYWGNINYNALNGTVELVSNVAILDSISSNTSKTMKVTMEIVNRGTKDICNINFLSPIFQNISLDTSNVQKNFYKKSTFNSNGLIVNANYQYQVGGDYVTKTITNYVVTYPNMGNKGSQTVTIGYNGEIATYTIFIHYAQSVKLKLYDSAATSQSQINNGAIYRYKQFYSNLEEIEGEYTITYTDNTTESKPFHYGLITNNPNFNVAETQTINYRVTALKTNEKISSSINVKVCELLEINVTTQPTKLIYASGETIDTSGIRVFAKFDTFNSDTNVSSYVSFDTVNVLNTVGINAIGVSYNNKTTSFNIAVNGAVDPVVDLSGVNNGDTAKFYQNTYLKGFFNAITENFNSIKNKIKLNYKNRVYSAIDVAPTDTDMSLTGDTLTFENYDNTIKNGNQTILVSKAVDGITISNTFNLETYNYDSIQVEGIRELVYYNDVDGGNADDWIDNSKFKVYGVDSTNQNRTELLPAQYTMSPVANTTLSLGENTVTFNSTEGVMSGTAIVNCSEDRPKDDATLTISGSLNITPKNNIYYYSVGETINTTNLNLVISEMTSGTHDVNITDNVYSKRLYKVVDDVEVNKDSFTFTNNDETGDYKLELSFLDLEPVVLDIVLDYVTDVTINENTTKLVYKAGEKLDLSQIKGIRTFASGDTDDIEVGNIDEIDYTFEKEDLSDNDSETVELDLTISGITTTIEFTIICLKSMAIDIETAYKISQFIDVNSITLTYSDDSTRVLSENELDNVSWSIGDSAINAGLDRESVPNIRSTNEFTLEASYTEGGLTVTDSEDITILALKEIQLLDGDNVIDELIFDYGSEIDSTLIASYKVKPIFNDDTEGNAISITEINDRTGSVLSNGQIIRNKIENAYVNYRWVVNNVWYDVLEVSFDIRCNKLTSLSLNWGNINSTHYVGDSLPLNTISNVVATFSALDDEEEYDADYVSTVNLAYNELNYSFSNGINLPNLTYQFNEIGNYTLVATYTYDDLSVTTSKNISVQNIQLNSLSVNYTGLTTYIEEQSIDISDSNLTVTAVFNNGNVTLSLSDLSFFELVDGNYVAFNINKQLSVADTGKTIYVEYPQYPNVYGTLMNLVVNAKTLSEINITRLPNKTEYTIGDIFSLDGIIVNATFSNGTTGLINPNSLSISGIVTNRALLPSDIQQEETGKIITISYTYNDITEDTTFNIDLVFPTLSKIRINTSYTKVIYSENDTFTSNGLLVFAVYENGYEEQLNSYVLDTSEFVSGSTISVPTIDNKKQYGLRSVPVTITNPYKQTDSIENNIDYKITIIGSAAIAQTSLKFNDEIDYDNYYVGETFNAKGVSFWVIDGDGNEYQTDFTTNPAIGTLFKKTQTIDVVCSFSNATPRTYRIKVNVAYSENAVQSYNYKIAIGDINGNLFTSITHGDTTIQLGIKENGEATYPLFRDNDITIDTQVQHQDSTLGFNVFNDVMANATSKCIGYMEMGVQDEYGNVIKNAHIVLFDDPINPIAGDGNVIVKFPHYVNGYADKINKCTFGIIYNKHLFVSGNSNYKNCDWHTESINVAQTENYNQIAESDYTYFSDLDYCFYGTDETKVIGYDIYRDGDLIIIKESSKTQATLYRREAKLITAIDSQGNTLTGNYEDAYPSFDINFNGGDGGLSNRSVINFMGDTLFLTKNGLKVLSSKDTTYNKEKVVYDVSSFINPRILNENLDDGYLYTFKEKLLLRTARGVYIGEYTLRNENKEYEWYFLGNINADLFFEYEDELYFMNNDGGFYKFSFDESNYKDNERTFIGVGGALLTNILNDNDGFDLDTINNQIIVNENYANSVEEGKDFNLITIREVDNIDVKSLIHANIGEFIEKNQKEYYVNNDPLFDPSKYIGIINNDTNTIEIKVYNENNELDKINTDIQHDLIDINKTIYVDLITSNNINSNAPVVDIAYKLIKYNNEIFDYRYKLIRVSDNVECDLSEMLTMRLSYIVNELERTKITNVQPYNNGKSFQLLGSHNTILDLIYYNNRNNKYSAVITSPKNVESFFITKPYDFGTILYEKTIWQWAVANDTELASYIDLGYLTSKKQGDYTLVVKTASGSRSYNYEDSQFSFDKIQFTSDKLPHIYNRFRVLSNIGFIRFIFKNNENSNIVIDKLSLVYTISQSIKGVK